jgi:hypothetical protein
MSQVNLEPESLALVAYMIEILLYIKSTTDFFLMNNTNQLQILGEEKLKDY